ncbi:hypothetical protein ACXZ66_10700 [Corynebacterium sp. S7]
MKFKKSWPALAVATALGVSTLLNPSAGAAPLSFGSSNATAGTPTAGEKTDDERDVASGDKSSKCNLDFNANSEWSTEGKHTVNSLVYTPFAQDEKEAAKYVESAGFLETHGWGDIRRVIAGTVYPLNDAKLTVTLPEGVKAEELTVSTETDFLWGANVVYGTFGERFTNKIEDADNKTKKEGNVITVDLGDLEALSAIDLRIQGAGLDSIDAELTGTWDPEEVAEFQAPEAFSEADRDAVDEVRPDCEAAAGSSNFGSSSSSFDGLLSLLK